MKTIGVLGGMSQTATAEYYRLINERVNRRLGGWNAAEMIISSVNFARIEHCVRNGLWEEGGAYLAGKAQGLERAGADFILCASNTMHRVSDDFMAGLRIPLLHIVDPTGQAIRDRGLTKVGLLGTRPVMASSYLSARYAEKFGVETFVPDAREQGIVDRIIFDELVHRVLRPESKQIYLEIIDRLQARGAQGLILGCTEIFLLVSQPDRPDFPMFDTTTLHVDAAVALALGA
jgi:aspartate racemase